MTDIKVGQLYKSDTYRFIITWIESCDICILFNNGQTMMYERWDLDDLDNLELIRSFETWQQAVNSKEFNDER